MVHLDVKTAFLYGDLNEEVFMELPDEYRASQDLVCKLRKSIYGLKQAPLQWYRKISSSLLRMGFIQSDSMLKAG